MQVSERLMGFLVIKSFGFDSGYNKIKYGDTLKLVLCFYLFYTAELVEIPFSTVLQFFNFYSLKNIGFTLRSN